MSIRHLLKHLSKFRQLSDRTITIIKNKVSARKMLFTLATCVDKQLQHWAKFKKSIIPQLQCIIKL